MIKETFANLTSGLIEGLKTYAQLYPEAKLPDIEEHTLGVTIGELGNSFLFEWTRLEGHCGSCMEDVYYELKLPFECIDNPAQWLENEAKAIEKKKEEEAKAKEAEKSLNEAIARGKAKEKEEKEKQLLQELKEKYEKI